MRILVAFVLILVVGSRLAGQERPKGSEPLRPPGALQVDPGIVKLMNGMKAAGMARDAAAMARSWDFHRTLEAVDRQGLIPDGGLPELGGKRDLMVGLLGRLMSKQMVDPELGIAWKWHEIRRVDTIEAGREVVLYCRHRDTENTRWHMRWWLSKRADAWKAHDVEIVDLGMRYSSLIGAGFGVAHEKDPQKRSTVLELVGLGQKLAVGETEGLAVKVEAVTVVGLPDTLKVFRHFMLATLLSDEGDPEGALKAARAALALDPAVPYLHLTCSISLNALEKYEDAMGHANRYAAAIGKDADYWSEIGDSLGGLERYEEAAEAHKKCLADDPERPYDVGSLAWALPASRQGEFIPYYLALKDPKAGFEEMADMLIETNELAALSILLALHEHRAPDDPHLPTYRNKHAQLVRLAKE